MKTILVGWVALLAIIFFAGTSEAQIPDQFHGVWQTTPPGTVPTCSEKDSDMRQTVSAERVDFHEGICWPRKVSVTSQDTLLMEAFCEQEDSQWQSRQEWKLWEKNGQRHLLVKSLDPANAYEDNLGLCSGGGSGAAGNIPGAPAEKASLCYREGMSELDIIPDGEGTARIRVELAQDNAHICSLEGTACKTPDGYLYSERLEDGTNCEIPVLIDDKGRVTFRNPGEDCKNHYCGARASFERIEFDASARSRCN